MGLFSWLFGKKKKESRNEEEFKTEIAAEVKPTEEKAEDKALPAPKKESAKPKASAKKSSSETAKIVTDEAAPEKEKILETEKDNFASAESTGEAFKEPISIPTSDEKEYSSCEKANSSAITGRFEINRSKDGKKFFFNLYASNKVGIATSQMYSSAQSALIGVNSVIANAEAAPIEDQTLKTYESLPFPKWILYIDKGGKYRFHLCAANGSNVCHSQGYTTKSACKNGIDSIIRSSRNAIIDKAYLNK